jgi:hypothetical protein
MKSAGCIALLVIGLSCTTTEVIECFLLECSTVAIVKDLTGLDGCGLVFELKDGSWLEPEYRVYVQPPKPEEDPLYYYELKANEKVQISYQSTGSASICMVGDVVFITCIKPYPSSSDN